MRRACGRGAVGVVCVGWCIVRSIFTRLGRGSDAPPSCSWAAAAGLVGVGCVGGFVRGGVCAYLGRGMKKWQTNLIKLVVMLSIIGLVVWRMKAAWDGVQDPQLHVDWRFGALAMVCFCGSMLASALVWLWLTRKMGDRSRKLPAIGAYIFSQMGKYVPGKVMLLFMRIERTKRLGMNPQVCTVATLVENAMYMVSGGLAAMVTLMVFYRDQPLVVAAVGVGVAIMLAAFYPPLFYKLVNKALVKMKQPPVEEAQQLGKTELLMAVLGFMPCWALGGLAVWCSTRAITLSIGQEDLWPLPGLYALSVTGGMASMLPGGLGSREAILGLGLMKVLENNAKAVAIAVGVQRLMQILAEVIMGATGAVLTSVKRLRRAKGVANVEGEMLNAERPS